jgi:hypothetical protein
MARTKGKACRQVSRMPTSSQLPSEAAVVPSSSPPPSEAAMMDVDLSALLDSAVNNLSLDLEESTTSTIALKRELVARGASMQLASLYASNKVSAIPLHRYGKDGSYVPAHKCKTCGTLAGPKHQCSKMGLRNWEKLMNKGGWPQAFKELDKAKWKIGPGNPPGSAVPQIVIREDLLKAALEGGHSAKLLLTPARPKKPLGDILLSPSIHEHSERPTVSMDRLVLLEQRKEAKAASRREKKARRQEKKREHEAACLVEGGETSIPADDASFLLPDGGVSLTGVPIMKASVPHRVQPIQQPLPAFDVATIEKDIASLSLDQVHVQSEAFSASEQVPAPWT